MDSRLPQGYEKAEEQKYKYMASQRFLKKYCGICQSGDGCENAEKIHDSDEHGAHGLPKGIVVMKRRKNYCRTGFDKFGCEMPIIMIHCYKFKEDPEKAEALINSIYCNDGAGTCKEQRTLFDY